MEKLIIRVDGMSCEHCKAAVEGAVESLDGVGGALVDLAAGTVEITYDAGKLGEGAFKTAIEEQGYDVIS